MSGTEIVTKVMVLPEGLALDDYNVRHFAINVEWKGARQSNSQGGYAVTDMFMQLSRAGNWGMPQKFQLHQYRWETFEEALEQARAHVEAHEVNGRTWTEWQAALKSNS